MFKPLRIMNASNTKSVVVHNDIVLNYELPFSVNFHLVFHLC